MTVHAKSHVYTMFLPVQVGMSILAIYIPEDLEGSVCSATCKAEAASKWGSTAHGMGQKKDRSSRQTRAI